MFGKRKLDDLSVEELEKALLLKRRQSRLERFQRLSGQGRPANEALLVGTEASPATPGSSSMVWPAPTPLVAPGFQPPTLQPLRTFGGSPQVRQEPGRPRKLRDGLLLALEVVSLVGLVAVLMASYFNLKELNTEVSQAQQNTLAQAVPTPTTAPPPYHPVPPARRSHPPDYARRRCARCAAALATVDSAQPG